jgi:4-hydroxy-2-oxoheptanedioate aldolase
MTINKAVDLLKAGQPVFCTGVSDLSHASGRAAAGTWADMIRINMEHGLFDIRALDEFMQGLLDGGPTASGHLTPAIMVELPVLGHSADAVYANAWQFQQLLARGVHALLLCHAEVPEAVAAYIECCRYSYHKQGVGAGLKMGTRGAGAQAGAGARWGVSGPEYIELADPWPLNPDGQLLLGIKIENQAALANAEASAAVPGLSFAEWGPGDMGLSFGHLDAHDPPYPPEMWAARNRVKDALAAHDVPFFEGQFSAENACDRFDEGVVIFASSDTHKDIAATVRAHAGRTMPV